MGGAQARPLGCESCDLVAQPKEQLREGHGEVFNVAAPALAARLVLLGVKPRVKWAVGASRGAALADEAAFVCLMHNLTWRQPPVTAWPGSFYH